MKAMPIRKRVKKDFMYDLGFVETHTCVSRVSQNAYLRLALLINKKDATVRLYCFQTDSNRQADTFRMPDPKKNTPRLSGRAKT